MKTFNLTLVVSANDNLTESEMFKRFAEMSNKTPKEVNRIVFNGDCSLTEIIVEDISKD